MLVLTLGLCLTIESAHAHGHMVYPKSRAAEHTKGDEKNWPIAGIPSRLRREPCAGLKPNSKFTTVSPGPLTIRLLFPDGANHRGTCTAYLYDPLKPDLKLRISETTDCARSIKRHPGQKGQDIPGEMQAVIPNSVPCDPDHCVLLWEWTATHMSPTNIERFEHYDNCADLKIAGARRADPSEIVAGLLEPVPAALNALSSDFFEQEWRLNPERSSLHLQSVKNETIFETHGFTHIEGQVSPNGDARVALDLASFDTGIDLRNVRMRILFFETFRFPEATITAKVDKAILGQLAQETSIIYPLDFELDLHGMKRSLTRDVVVTRVADKAVSISATKPIVILAEDFDLLEGADRLEAAAGVNVSPVASITFDLVFEGAEINPGVEEIYLARQSARSAEKYQQIDPAMCETRFAVLSDAQSIFFKSGSAVLDDTSRYGLDQLAEFIFRCPDISLEVGGHTDNVGNPGANMALSEARSNSVVKYLVDEGVPAEKLLAVGYGDALPKYSNDTPQNRARNRRIEFTLANR